MELRARLAIAGLVGLAVGLVAGVGCSPPVDRPCEETGCAPPSVCDTTTHDCVADPSQRCEVTGCGSGTHCDAATGNCVADGCQLTGCATGTHCDTATGSCVADPGSECETTGCAPELRCNTTTHACEPIPGTCAACSPDQACDAGTCLACRTDVLCSAADTACAAPGGRCALCRGNTCPADFPYCTAYGCSECQSNADCPTNLPVCDGQHCVECGSCADGGVCLHGTCTQTCRIESDCPAERPHCNWYDYDMTDRCEECSEDFECPAGQACFTGTCRDALPGDTCSNPVPIAIGPGGRVVTEGSMVRYSDSSVFYAVTLAEDSLLSINLDTGTYTRGFLYLHERCDDWNFEIASGSGSDATGIPATFLAAGTYYVEVGIDTFGYYYSLDYTLILSAAPASRPAGSDCSNRILLPVGGPGPQQVTVSGDLTGMRPLGCGADAGLEYGIDLKENSLVRATVTPGRADEDLSVAIDRSCWRLGGCTPQGTPGVPVVVVKKNLPPGPAAISVGANLSPGPYTMLVETRPYPVNNTCYRAEELGFDGGVGEVVVSSDTTDVDPTPAGCSSYTNVPAVHYRFSTLDAGVRSLSLELLAQQTDAGVIALSTDCRQSSSYPLSCARAAVDDPRLPEGDYRIQVSDTGTFTMRATLGPPIPQPAGDLCSVPEPLTLDAGAFGPVIGTTRGATDDQPEYICGSYRFYETPSRDVVYRLPANGRGIVTATVTPTEATFDPVLELGATCSSKISCGTGAPAGAAESVRGRVSGDVYLRVDSEHRTSGDFTLSGTFSPPPANDVCTGATPLVFGQTVTGDIGLAFADTNPCDNTVYSADLFYTFIAPSNGTATVTLAPTGFDGRLGRTSDCVTTWCASGVDSYGVGTAETHSFAVTRNTSYVISVSGRDPSAVTPTGTFTLSLSGP